MKQIRLFLDKWAYVVYFTFGVIAILSSEYTSASLWLSLFAIDVTDRN